MSSNQKLSEKERQERHREAQRRYMEKQKMGWDAALQYKETITLLQTQNISLQQLLNVSEYSKQQLQNQVNNLSMQLEAQNNIIEALQQNKTHEELSVKDNLISDLNQQISDKNISVSRLETALLDLERQVNEHRNQLAEKDNLISDLNKQISEKNISVSRLENTFFDLERQVNEHRNQLAEKDNLISELNSSSSNCSLAEQETINQLNNELSTLNIYGDLIKEINCKYPKIIASLINEFSQPGNHVVSPRLNEWIQSQLPLIDSSQIIPLSSFKAGASPSFIATSDINIDPDFIRYINIKRTLGIKTKTKTKPVTEEEKELNRLYQKLYHKYRLVPNV